MGLVTVEDGGVLRAELAPGASAYLDREWIHPRPPGPVAAVIVGPDDPPAGVGPDVAAARVLLSVAREAAAAVEEGTGSVEVVGSGVMAHAVRALIGLRAQASWQPAGGVRPRAIVDTTGDPDTIREATRRLADLGTLVLAGEPLGRTIPIELYPDVHVRGLELVAIGMSSSAEASAAPPNGNDESLGGVFEESLRTVAPGAPLPADGLWYRLAP